jgi:hypothetical protein
MKIVISSGHGQFVRGAYDILDEVTEARRVVDRVAEILASHGVGVQTFHDNVSTTQNENLNRIVDFHNAQARDLDCSIHFNAYEHTSKPMGTETLYVTQEQLAKEMSAAIAKAGVFINRGPKHRSDLFFLNNTEEPALLLEICFVDSSADAELYRTGFEPICRAIATTISGESRPAAKMPPPLSREQEMMISEVAMKSTIAKYGWRDRGVAPAGYVQGFALAFVNTYRQLLIRYPAAMDMARANTGNADKDVLAWYADVFDDFDMDNSKDGPDTLRHLWALLMGLGMRESSGRYCEGRDMSAENVSSDTAEAGLFQTSYNAHTSSDSFNLLFDAFQSTGRNKPQGFVDYFRQGVSCSSTSWKNYGSGDGAKFQHMCKHQPAFACETCAIVLRNLRQHYGPINRHEAELKVEADEMLHEVQDWIDRLTQGEV